MRVARRVRKGACGRRPAATPAPRPQAYLTRPPGHSSTKATRTPRPGSLKRPPRSSRARPPPPRPASAAAPPPSGTPQPNAKAPTPARTTSPPRRNTWTTPPPSPPDGRSPPASSRERQDGWSKTAWTSPAPAGDSKEPRPSSNSAPSSATATSTSTGATTCAKNTNGFNTPATAKATPSPPDQLTLEEPHPLRTAHAQL